MGGRWEGRAMRPVGSDDGAATLGAAGRAGRGLMEAAQGVCRAGSSGCPVPGGVIAQGWRTTCHLLMLGGES